MNDHGSPPAPLNLDAEEEFETAVALLEADPGHYATWLRVAARLCDDPCAGPEDRATAQKGLDSVAAALGEAGHLPLAIVACLRLSQRGDERACWTRLLQLGNAYGKSSTRVDPARRIPVPMASRSSASGSSSGRFQALQVEVPEPGVKMDGATMRARAAAALRKAAAQAAITTSGPREPLPAVPLFSALSPDTFVRLAESLKVIDAPAGSYLIGEGDLGDGLFIVARGTVRIERPDYTVLARLRAGSFFGEMALLHQAPASAFAIAETPAVLLKASAESLQQLVARDEAIARVLSEHALRRLEQNSAPPG